MAKKAVFAACALTIGGLDPGGGAGLAADLRAFAAANVFGCLAVAVNTVQSTSGLRSARAVRSREVVDQAREVMRHQHVRAIKTGALGSAANVRAIGDFLARHPNVPAVVDPVMLPSRGAGRLLAVAAVDVLKKRLIPRAALVTANVPEAEVITGARITSVQSARDAAHHICRLGARAALVKGGHLGGREAIDVLVVDGETLELRAPRLTMAPLHGGGCVLASLIAGHIAADDRAFESDGAAILKDAVKWAKKVHRGALARPRDVGGDLRVLML